MGFPIPGLSSPLQALLTHFVVHMYVPTLTSSDLHHPLPSYVYASQEPNNTNNDTVY